MFCVSNQKKVGRELSRMKFVAFKNSRELKIALLSFIMFAYLREIKKAFITSQLINELLFQQLSYKVSNPLKEMSNLSPPNLGTKKKTFPAIAIPRHKPSDPF